jgi:hypothetical protein
MLNPDFLTTQGFLESTNGLTAGDINSQYVNTLVKSLNSLIVRKIGIATGKTKQYHRKNSPRVVFVEAWQRNGVVGENPSDLVIKRGQDGSSNFTTLTEGQDYRLEFSSEDYSDNIVVAVILFHHHLNTER